jgi:hypothetical protein
MRATGPHLATWFPRLPRRHCHLLPKVSLAEDNGTAAANLTMGANVICTHEWITYTLDLILILILIQSSLSLLFLHFLLPKTMARQPRISQPVQTQPARMNEIIRRLQADRCTGSIKLCTDTLRADSRLELHVHFCIQAGYHADNPPWGLSPGCTRMHQDAIHTHADLHNIA